MVNEEVESEPEDMEVGSAGWVRVERGVRRQEDIALIAFEKIADIAPFRLRGK